MIKPGQIYEGTDERYWSKVIILSVNRKNVSAKVYAHKKDMKDVCTINLNITLFNDMYKLVDTLSELELLLIS